jgi:DNA polymerase (family 10)
MMVETPSAYGALLQHFTGSKQHNIAIRDMAIKKGWSVSDYGIKIKGKLVKIDTEEKLYKKLGLEFIPPELREDTGELQAAKNNKIPRLTELSDVKGDLHIHSNFNIETSHDTGASSMEEVIKRASELGYEYIAFTEHNPAASTHSSKQINDLLKRKRDKIEKTNYSFKSNREKRVKKIFNSLEIDIKSDGSLPVNDEGLNLLDFALVSIHASFQQSREAMTSRVLRALSHPKVKIFAHPTARKLNERESVELDWSKIFDFCLKNNKWVEINSDPSRLDLPDFLVKEAVENGVKLVISTDSHHKDHMSKMRYGVYVARRGWATSFDIANTRSLKEFEKMLQ